MTTPIDLLKEYKRGIDEQISRSEDKKELKEMNRIRLMYVCSIHSIEMTLNKARTMVKKKD